MRTIKSELIHNGRAFSVVSDLITFPDGREASRDVVRHPGAVVILAVSERQTIYLVRQYRHPLEKNILELPAGTLEVNEPPIECAKREIREEIGYAAKSWKSLGKIYPAPGFCDECQYLFFASDLYPEKLKQDDDEYIEVEEVAISDISSLIKEEQLVDAKSIALLYKAQILGLIKI